MDFENCKGKGQDKAIVNVLLSSTLYHIWWERNLRKFLNKTRSAPGLAAHTIRKVRKHMSTVIHDLKASIKSRILWHYLRKSPTRIRKAQVQCKWIGQAPDVVLINSDGSVRGDNFSCGGFLCGSDCKPIICYSGKEGTGRVLEQELRGLGMDLRTGVEKNIRRIANATDSEQLVKILAKKIKEPWYLSNLVRKIFNHIDHFEQWRIYHVFRECNSAADWLANRDRPIGFCCFSEPYEPGLLAVVRQDKDGTMYPRN